MHTFNKAPLPFLGQKRNYLKLIREMDFNGKTVIDLFGGSGLLSHTIKQSCSSARVIFNDFDDYQSRLAQIDITEQLRQRLYDLTYGMSKNRKIELPLKQQLIDVIVASGCTDFITLSSWLCFSGHYSHALDTLIKDQWYARVTGASLVAEGYLQGVERVQADFRELLSQYRDGEAIIIADPPYVMTSQLGYASAKSKQWPCFRLKDGIDLIKSIYHCQAIYFSSIKSESDALFEVWTPSKMERLSYKVSVGGGAVGEEYMFLLNWS